MGKSGTNKAAMGGINECREEAIEVRQNTYLNIIVEQDNRALKRILKPMLGFKSFWPASKVLAGIELMHITQRRVQRLLMPRLAAHAKLIRKGQMIVAEGENMSFADQLYLLAG
jgi:putative transposase